ncbi:MAG: substrate-binding domain-containing protein [Verrucomicrobiota bacterium]
MPAKKKIAILNLPIVPETRVSIFDGIRRFVEENTSWEFVFNGTASDDFMRFFHLLNWDGVIARVTDDRTRRFFSDQKRPAVNVSAWFEEAGIPTVRRDEYANGVSAAEHLLSKGLSRFACIKRRGGGWYQATRLLGFMETLSKAGRTCEVFRQRAPLNNLVEATRFKDWVENLKPPFGIFVTEDVGMQKVIDSFNLAGVKIPRDAALVGAVNQPEVVRRTSPSLSSVNPNEVAVGYLAAKMLDRLMRGRPIKDISVNVPPLKLVERESSQVFTSDDGDVRKAVEFIRVNFTQPISVTDIADYLSLSKATLYRRFIHHVGEAPHDIIEDFRVKKARSLLLEDLYSPLEDVAIRCGFSGNKHLNRAFTRRIGISPMGWRKQGSA